MTESSILWTTDGVGDGANAGYTMAQVTEWMRMLMCGLTGGDLSGVAPDYLNELAVTGTVSPAAVNTGGALVYGFPYFNSASVNVAVPTPSSATRVDLIVLEADWTAQTVRIARVEGVEGAGAPSLTQSAGTTWQMVLAQASITTGGTITVTDAREWLNAVGDGMVSTAKLQADAVTGAKIGDDQIDSEHYVAGSIDNEHLAANSVDSDQYVDGSIDEAHLSFTPSGAGIAWLPIQHHDAPNETLSTTYVYGKASIALNKADLPAGATVKLNVVGQAGSGETATYQFYDLTNGAERSALTTTSTSAVLMESADLAGALAAGDVVYIMQFKTSVGSIAARMRSAYLKVEW